MGPLVNADGTIAVSKRKFPSLYRCLERSMPLISKERLQWQRVIELRREGKDESANRLARKLLGITGPEMTEETKAKLKAYNEANKEKIAARRAAQRALRRAISKPVARRTRR